MGMPGDKQSHRVMFCPSIPVSLDLEKERQIYQNKCFVSLQGKIIICWIKAEQTAVVMHDGDRLLLLSFFSSE